jgi:iron complex transport system ATP-binding protein
VLAVLHDPNLALRYADRVWVLDGGALQASGHPARVLRPALVQRVWRVQASTVRAADGVPQLLIAAGVPQLLIAAGVPQLLIAAGVPLQPGKDRT